MDDQAQKKSVGPWIETFGLLPMPGWSGRQYSARSFHLLYPPPMTTEEIVRGVSRACRYAGQTYQPYPVLAHSLLVARACQLRWQHQMTPGEMVPHLYWAILHDAPEAITGDLTAPLQAALGPEAKARLASIQEGIAKAYYREGLKQPYPSEQVQEAVKEVDFAMVTHERNCLGLFPWEKAAEWTFSDEVLHPEIDELLRAKYVYTRKAHFGCYSPDGLGEARRKVTAELAEYDKEVFSSILQYAYTDFHRVSSETEGGMNITYLLQAWADVTLSRVSGDRGFVSP